MAPDPHSPADLPVDMEGLASEDENESSGAEGEDAADLMVVTRTRRSNAGNRMKTLLAAQEDVEEQEQWGEEWEEAPDEEEFVGNDGDDQGDFNLESSSSEDEDAGDDDDAGEKELRRAERQERDKKRKKGANPFTAGVTAAAKKRVKLDVPTPASTETTPAPRPKKRIYTHSIPAADDGPARQSSRRQTVANKQETTERLKQQEAQREKTLAQMKAAEERKEKHKPKVMTQEERLAEAAKVEKQNSKSLHRWEEAEEKRAADRQAKLDALKSRELEGPFIRHYSGPAIWIDNKLKYTGKDAPKVEELEEKLNSVAARTKEAKRLQDAAAAKAKEASSAQTDSNAQRSTNSQEPNPQGAAITTNSGTQPESTAVPQQPQPQPLPTTTPIQPVPYPNSIMFAPPQNQNSFLFGIEHWASLSDPANLPFGSASLPPQPRLPPQFPLPLPQPHPPQTLQPPQPSPPPAPIPKKQIDLALRSLITLSSFPSLASLPPYSHRTTSTTKDKKNPAHTAALTVPLFAWSPADALSFASLQPSRYNTKNSALPLPEQLKCVITGLPAWYRDPGTGLGYRDAYAFKCVKRVVNGGVRWAGELGCYVGPVFAAGGGGARPARGVPARFLGVDKGRGEEGVVRTVEMKGDVEMSA